MTVKKRWLSVFVIVCVGLWCWHKHRAGAAPEAPTVVVNTAAVKVAPLPLTVKAIGTITATTVDITPESAGRVVSIAFTDGAEVKQGDLLIQLDDALLKAKLASMTAEYQFSDASYQRLQKLAGKGIIPQQSIDQANADRKEKKAALDEAMVINHQMTLTAPFDGRVSEHKVNVGDYVNVGQSVVTLTDTHHLRVEYHLPEADYAKLQLGQPVSVTSNAYPGHVFHGQIAYIAPTINPDDRTVAVYATLDPVKVPLASGLFVNVTQAIGLNKQAYFIPSRSLVPGLNGDSVYKVVNGKAVSVDVTVGERTSTEVQIIAGLTASDQVVTDGQVKLTNGQPVTTQVG